MDNLLLEIVIAGAAGMAVFVGTLSQIFKGRGKDNGNPTQSFLDAVNWGAERQNLIEQLEALKKSLQLAQDNFSVQKSDLEARIKILSDEQVTLKRQIQQMESDSNRQNTQIAQLSQSLETERTARQALEKTRQELLDTIAAESKARLIAETQNSELRIYTQALSSLTQTVNNALAAINKPVNIYVTDGKQVEAEPATPSPETNHNEKGLQENESIGK